jgi:phage terminase Nu1 subunit (DNA packaging protein)
MQAELWTLSGLAVELGRDRRALASALEGLAPDEQETDAAGRVTRKYRMARVFEHLMGGAADLDLNAERARLAKAQADTHEANLAVRCGELLERSRVIREVGAMLASFQSRAIVIPDAVGQLLDPKTARTVVPAVREKIYEALAEMSEYRPELPAGYSEDSSASAESDGERVGGSEPQAVKRKQRGAGSVAN